MAGHPCLSGVTADEVVAAVERLAPAGGPAPGAERATALTGDTR